MATENDRDDKVSWLPLILIAFGIFAAWLLTVPVAKWFVAEQKYDQLGSFGDVFGAINALFSGLAFAGLFYAILLQRKELSLQRKELRDTRGVLASQKAEAEKQNTTLRQQTFENMFFQVLRQHGELVAALSVRDDNGVWLTGRNCFSQYYQTVWRQFSHQTGGAPNLTIDQIVGAIHQLDSYLETNLGHYFRSLCGLVAYVDQSAIENKGLYVRIIRDSLTPQEVSLAFYRCIDGDRYQEFRSMMEKFGMLKNLDSNFMFSKTAHKQLLGANAFA